MRTELELFLKITAGTPAYLRCVNVVIKFELAAMQCNAMLESGLCSPRIVNCTFLHIFSIRPTQEKHLVGCREWGHYLKVTKPVFWNQNDPQRLVLLNSNFTMQSFLALCTAGCPGQLLRPHGNSLQ